MSFIPKKMTRSKVTEMYVKEHLKQVNKIETGHPFFSRVKYLQYLKNDTIKYIINPLIHNNSFQIYNLKPKKTIIVSGLKNIGKRFFLKSVCTEHNFSFLDVFIDNKKDIKDCFQKAIDMEPCIIYLNSIFNDEKEELLFEIKRGAEKISDKKIIIAICCENKCFLPENALKLANHSIDLRVPDELERKMILESFNLKGFEQVDFDKLSRLTPGHLAIDLYNLCVSAVSESIINGRNVQFEDFLIHLRSNHKISLDDVGALENVKEELQMNIILPLKYPNRFKKLGIDRTSGILLYGPPGCGKTMLAKAIANMLFCNFMSISGPELINKYVGDTEKELRQIFNRAKNQQPCILFFDEIDSLCSKRNDNEFQTRVVNQMLTLLDGIDEKGKVFIIGATNRIQALDRAIIRPGRFDKVIEVPLPCKTERIEIFKKCVEKIKIEDFSIENFELEGFSGADIAGFVREASLIALKNDFENENIVLSEKHFVEAYKNIIERKNRFLNE